jgi:hypothetical protein
MYSNNISFWDMTPYILVDINISVVPAAAYVSKYNISNIIFMGPEVCAVENSTSRVVTGTHY